MNSVFNSCHFLQRSEACVLLCEGQKGERSKELYSSEDNAERDGERQKERVTYILKSPFIDVYSHFVPVFCHTTDLMKMHLFFISRMDTLQLHVHRKHALSVYLCPSFITPQPVIEWSCYCGKQREISEVNEHVHNES